MRPPIPLQARVVAPDPDVRIAPARQLTFDFGDLPPVAPAPPAAADPAAAPAPARPVARRRRTHPAVGRGRQLSLF